MRPLGAPIVSFDVHGHWNRIVVSGRELPKTREIARLFRDTPQLARAVAQARLPPGPAAAAVAREADSHGRRRAPRLRID